MPIHYRNNISYYTFSLLDEYHLVHGVFMRYGGVSPKPWASLNMATSVGDSRKSVIENRKRITNCLTLDEGSIFDVWQVHGTNVVHAAKSRKLDQPHQKADAIITNKPNVTILMLFADCVPIMLYDPENNVAALVHAGWQGTVNRVVSETVKSMQKKYGCKPKNLIACIGPSICVDHYKIGKEVADEVRRVFKNPEQILLTKGQNLHLDLQTANRIILNKHGIKRIQDSRICTACNTGDWYSHRAEKGKTGRFAAIISIT